MTIEKLSSESNNKYANVTLTYEEIRDISNALYYLISGEKCDVSKYQLLYAKSKMIFDMVKHGMIQPETINAFSEKEGSDFHLEPMENIKVN